MDRLAEIYELLYRLGAGENYNGFYQLAQAIALALDRPERLSLVTKWIYPEVAKQYEVEWKTVERNIRTVSCVIWQCEPRLLQCLAGKPIQKAPSAAQLLVILSHALLMRKPGALLQQNAR